MYVCMYSRVFNTIPRTSGMAQLGLCETVTFPLESDMHSVNMHSMNLLVHRQREEQNVINTATILGNTNLQATTPVDQTTVRKEHKYITTNMQNYSHDNTLPKYMIKKRELITQARDALQTTTAGSSKYDSCLKRQTLQSTFIFSKKNQSQKRQLSPRQKIVSLHCPTFYCIFKMATVLTSGSSSREALSPCFISFIYVTWSVAQLKIKMADLLWSCRGELLAISFNTGVRVLAGRCWRKRRILVDLLEI